MSKKSEWAQVTCFRCDELRHIMLVTGQDEEEEYQNKQSVELTKIGNDLAR